MSMIPFIPSLRLPMASRLDTTPMLSEESQIAKCEREYQNWMQSFRTCDLNPLGKVPIVPNEDEDEDANDDSDSDSHDDEEEDTNDREVNT